MFPVFWPVIINKTNTAILVLLLYKLIEIQGNVNIKYVYELNLKL